MQIHQTQAQQQQQITAQALLPYSGFLPNTTLPPPTLISAPPRAPQAELLNFSNTLQFSTKPINFANTDKTNSSQLPLPIHTVSNVHDTTYDISPLSDISNSGPNSSHFFHLLHHEFQIILLIRHKEKQLILNACYRKHTGTTLLI